MNNSSNILKLSLLFVVAVLAQVLIVNNIQLSGFVNPYLYIIFIMTLPFGITRGLLMILSFIIGLTIDLFCDTPGMHAAACTLIGFLRVYMLKLIAYREEYKDDNLPTANLYGYRWYLKYTLMIVTAHHVALFFIEQFDTLFFWSTILRIILSIISTIITIMIVQFVMPQGKNSNDY